MSVTLFIKKMLDNGYSIAMVPEGADSYSLKMYRLTGGKSVAARSTIIKDKDLFSALYDLSVDLEKNILRHNRVHV